MNTPDFTSVEEFVGYLLDEDRFTFTFEEAAGIAEALGQSVPTYVIRELKGWGLTMVPREPEKRVRGFQTSSHDRWFGPGSSPTHGGSGWEQITGFAGQKG
jgi:hypothetical protein